MGSTVLHGKSDTRTKMALAPNSYIVTDLSRDANFVLSTTIAWFDPERLVYSWWLATGCFSCPSSIKIARDGRLFAYLTVWSTDGLSLKTKSISSSSIRIVYMYV